MAESANETDFADPGQGRSGPGRYLTIQALSELTTCSVSTLRRLKKAGVIVAFQPGGKRHRMFFPIDAVESVRAATAAADPSPGPPSPAGPAEAPRPLRGPPAKWMAGL